MRSQDTFSVVIPVYNEEEVLPIAYNRLKHVLDNIDGAYELIFVNDGSMDGSQAVLEELSLCDPLIKLITFSRNFGHQVAISAGMDFATGDAVVVIDADLQDPPEVIVDMVTKWRAGYDVVYARRKERLGETWFKRVSATLFYRMLNRLTDVDIPLDTGDFRLIDRKVCDVMKALREKNRFVRGLIAWSGFRQTAVEYVRAPRFAGETKYPLRRMLKLSSDAMISFSDKPLLLPLVFGAGLSGLSVLFLAVALIIAAFMHHLTVIPIPLYFIGIGALFTGWILAAIGIVGQYLSRVYDDVQDRPLYVVKSQTGFGAGAEVSGFKFKTKVPSPLSGAPSCDEERHHEVY